MEGLRKDPLDYKNTLVLRLMMLVGIYIFHAGTFFHFMTPDCGHTCVAVFFFLSGFGLEYSLTNKKGYMRTFLQKRVLGLLLQYWIVVILCAVMTGIVYLSWDIIHNDANLWVFNYVNWYILELLTFYVIYFISAMITKNLTRLAFILVAMIVVMYAFTDNYMMDLYYKSGITFLLGIIWYQNEEKIQTFLERLYVPLLIAFTLILLFPYRIKETPEIDFLFVSVTSIMSCVVTYMVMMADLKHRWFIPILTIIIGCTFIWYEPGPMGTEGAAMLLLAGATCIIYQIPLLGRIAALGGAMSLELFLLHFQTFHWVARYFDDFEVMISVSIVSTVIIAAIAHTVSGRIMASYNKGVDGLSAASRAEL